jgi:hypothetical protein
LVIVSNNRIGPEIHFVYLIIEIKDDQALQLKLLHAQVVDADSKM